MPEDRSENIVVRKVTEVHANWSEHGSGEAGKFSFQLILDDGAEEHLIRPNAEDADVLKDLFDHSGDVYFDQSRGNVIFRSLS
jgi:hypothetical protein